MFRSSVVDVILEMTKTESRRREQQYIFFFREEGISSSENRREILGKLKPIAHIPCDCCALKSLRLAAVESMEL